MEKALGVPVMEQEQFSILLGILEAHNMEQEKKQVVDIAEYLDTMDKRLDEILNELQEVKEQLREIKDKGVKAAAARVITSVQGKIQEAKVQLTALKERFTEGMVKTVEAFKEKGAQALTKTLNLFGIHKGIKKLHNHLELSILAADRGIERLGNMADEVHEAKTHIGNIGRVLTGREQKRVVVRDVEKGAVYQMQKGLFYVMGVMKGMKHGTEVTLQRLAGFTEKTGQIRKPSVRENLQAICKDEKQTESKTVEPGQSQNAQITFFAAECMESTTHGELRDNLTLPEAVKAYQEIRKRGSSSGPGIGFILRDSSQPDYWFSKWPLFQGGRIAQDEIDQIPFYRDHPLVKQAVQDIKQFFPNAQKGEKHPAR